MKLKICITYRRLLEAIAIHKNQLLSKTYFAGLFQLILDHHDFSLKGEVVKILQRHLAEKHVYEIFYLVI